MDCFSPISIRVRDGPSLYHYAKVPCGRCEYCVRRKQEQWFTRLRIEADHSLYANFITLTYNDENIPKDLSVNKSDVQLFHKRLRSKLSKPEVFKYYLTSEYGPDGHDHRPHYHAIYYGIPPQELHFIEEAWDKGFVSIDEITDGRLRYVTGYIIEKLFVPPGREPVFNLISKGLGESYIDSHKSWHLDLPISERSYVPYHGKHLSLPRYYKEKIYSKGQRNAYANLMAIKADEREAEYREKLGDDAYFNQVYSRSAEFIRKVKNIHKKKKTQF